MHRLWKCVAFPVNSHTFQACVRVFMYIVMNFEHVRGFD
jgi:hypothetical protein